MARTSRFLAPLMVLALLLSSAALVLPSQQVLAANEQWTVQVEFVTDPPHGQVIDPNPLEFGTDAASSDGIDGNDVAGGLQGLAPDDATAYFPNAAASPNDKLRVDYRAPVGANAGDAEVWQLTLIKDSGNASDMTLTWDDISGVANFPLDASIVLSGGGQNINMRSTTTATYANGSNYNLTITVTRLGAPTEVWVDDDWSAASDGDLVGDGYVFGYNAFAVIQDGIDAIEDGAGEAGGVIHVLSSEDIAAYSAFTISEDNVQVLAEDGAMVSGGCTITSDNATGIVVDTLVFDHGTVLCQCNDTDDVTLSNLEVIGSAVNGIVVDTTVPDSTVYIENPVIHGCVHGIDVSNDSVIITNPTIYDCQYGIYAHNGANVTMTGGSIAGGYPHGIHATTSTVTVSGTEIHGYAAGEAEPEGSPYGYGIYVGNNAAVTLNDCCSIHDNNYGIWVASNASVTANGNSIFNNTNYGLIWDAHIEGAPLDCEENWWGDEAGPIGCNPSILPRDGVSCAIDYTPWLDGPCPSGDPVGLDAKLKAPVRSGEPGLEVSFTDVSTPAPGCEIEEWLWDFGDGSTSSAQNPSHVYTREGSYTVTLTVVDSCGFKDSITMRAYISIKKSGGEALEPARMVVSYLLIDPLQVLPGQEVLVSGNVCNQGEERGSKTVSLMVNGVAEQSQTVGVSGGSCQQVSFRLSRAVPGTYQVAIDGMTGQFSVLAPRIVTNNVPSQQDSGLGTVGIVIIIALAVAIITALIFLFRK